MQNILIELEMTPSTPPPNSRLGPESPIYASLVSCMIVTVCFFFLEVGHFFVCCMNWSLMVKPTAGDRLIYR